MTIKVKRETAVEEVRRICAEVADAVSKELIEAARTLNLDHAHSRLNESAGAELVAERIRSLQFEVEDGWVSVEDERKPTEAIDEYQSVPLLLYVPGMQHPDSPHGAFRTGNYLFRSKQFRPYMSQGFEKDVTHWRYWPAPPKAEEGSDERKRLYRGGR